MLEAGKAPWRPPDPSPAQARPPRSGSTVPGNGLRSLRAPHKPDQSLGPKQGSTGEALQSEVVPWECSQALPNSHPLTWNEGEHGCQDVAGGLDPHAGDLDPVVTSRAHTTQVSLREEHRHDLSITFTAISKAGAPPHTWKHRVSSKFAV